MIPLAQGSSDHATEGFAGSQLHEESSTLLPHGLHTVLPPDGPGQLPGQQAHTVFATARVRLRCRVGVDRGRGNGEIQAVHTVRKGSLCRCDERTMEGSRHRNPPGPKLGHLAGSFRRVDGLSATGNHALRRRILVRQHDIQSFFLDQALDGLEGSQHHQHGAPVLAIASHQLAAPLGGHEEFLGRERSRSVQRDQLAVAVTRVMLSLETKARHQSLAGTADRTQCRLGHIGGGQRSLLGLTSRVVQGWNGIDGMGQRAQSGEPLHELGKETGQLQQHIDPLSTLTGEDEGHGLGRPLRVVATKGRGPLGGRRRQRLQHLLNPPSSVLLRTQHKNGPMAVGRGEVGHRSRVLQQGLEGLLEPIEAGCADGNDVDAPIPSHLGALGSVLFEHRMEVRATKTETANRSTARVLTTGQPWTSTVAQIEGTVLKTELRVGLLRCLQSRQQHLVTKG